MKPRLSYHELEKQLLAPYAQLSSESLGRIHTEKECDLRACFYRDLGRIVHSTAFRLLEYKTQVFVNHEGDYYRTRLTHSIEVSQMARGLARILRVNEDLAHTIALAHDLGHSPFGHTGEVSLNKLMQDEGGFEHNTQGYRVVTFLEERYPDFPGLNLSYEVLEGILKHTTEYDKPTKVDDFKDVGYPTIEAQIVNFADEIAYMNHDLDDGIHWGMLSVDSLREVPLWKETYDAVLKEIPDATERIQRIRTISLLIGRLIDDLQAETQRRIEDRGIQTLDDIRKNGNSLVGFSDAIKDKTTEVKSFLLENVYHHEKVRQMSDYGGRVVQDLFRVYLNDPHLLPEKYWQRFEADGQKRHICDYVAGMTDRFALIEHKKLFDR